MSKENKIAIIIALIVFISIPTWFTYQDENLAWLITDASRLIRINIAILGFYFLTQVYHLRVAILGYFLATLSNVITVFLSDSFLDKYSAGIFYIRLILLGGSLIFFLIYLKNALKVFYTDGKYN